MTLREAISEVDELYPNSYNDGHKVRWLSELDGNIRKKIIDTHDGAPETPFTGYTINSLDEQLIVPFPFESIYRWWLIAQIDITDGEVNRYNNDIALYNKAYSEFWNDYNAGHMPIGENINYF